MTKEEYERLLKSDYWKGYSYSLIKERNFTCHDCGQSFPGERNKLQVHHLHYRDTNPWSYDPEELVVLCEKCHKKRHGILTPESPAHEAPKFNQQFETGGIILFQNLVLIQRRGTLLTIGNHRIAVYMRLLRRIGAGRRLYFMAF